MYMSLSRKVTESVALLLVFLGILIVNSSLIELWA